MSFRDIIKKSVLESFTGSSITTVTVCVTLAITIVLALYIFIVSGGDCSHHGEYHSGDAV